jgi:hypothetical protein
MDRRQKRKTFKTMKVDNLLNRIVGNFPDAIVTDEDGCLDFEESVYNIAVKILDTLQTSQLYSVFGQAFIDYDECYDYLYRKLPGLREKLELFVAGD